MTAQDDPPSSEKIESNSLEEPGLPSWRARKYSLIRGGPFYQLQRSAGLIRQNQLNVSRRAVLFALVTWLPLVILAIAQGLAIRQSPLESLLLDFAVYARSLIAIPLFIFTEEMVDRRIGMAVRHFIASGLVDEAQVPAFDTALARTNSLRDSVLAQVVLLGLAYVVVYLKIEQVLHDGVSTWLDPAVAGNQNLSLAGWWSALVSQPVFLFLLGLWIWRWMICTIYLWCISNLNLRLTSTHPDRAGGLGFLENVPGAFVSIVFAIASVLSAQWGHEILYNDVSVLSYRLPLFIFILLVLLVLLGPLALFSVKLFRLKYEGVLAYGALANRHSQLFEQKWVRQGSENDTELLGTPDISSLADLSTDYEIVQTMRPAPISVRVVVTLVAAALIPMLPIIAIQIPLREIIKRLVSNLL